jgi:hypothetical protein
LHQEAGVAANEFAAAGLRRREQGERFVGILGIDRRQFAIKYRDLPLFRDRQRRVGRRRAIAAAARGGRQFALRGCAATSACVSSDGKTPSSLFSARQPASYWASAAPCCPVSAWIRMIRRKPSSLHGSSSRKRMAWDSDWV